MSSALPWGSPSLMSTSTTSAWSRAASTCAHVAPTFPAPTTVIFRRPLILRSLCGRGGLELFDQRVRDLARAHGGRVVARALHVVRDALALADQLGDRTLEP